MKNWLIGLTLSLTLVFLSGAFSAGNTYGAGENWLTGWGNRIKITIDHTKINADLTNFPILVHISASSGRNNNDISDVFNELASNTNRKKIAVTTSDGTTQCYVEISYWSNAEEQAALWVKAPSVSSTIDTELYLYYDPAHSDNNAYVGDVNSTPGEAVWDANYTGVFHLTENSDGTAGEFKDSTSNRNHGKGGYTDQPTRVTNEIGLPCQLTDGVNDFIELPDNDGFSIPVPGDFSVEMMYSPEVLDSASPTHYVCPAAKWASGEKEWLFDFYDANYEPRPHWCSFYVCSTPEQTLDAGGYYQPVSIMPVDSWWHFGATVHCTSSTSGIQYIYRNGEHRGAESTWEDYDVTYVNGSGPIRIGNISYSGSQWCNARFYEFRVSNVTRSQAWLKASSFSAKDDLLTFEFEGMNNSSPILNPIGSKAENEGSPLSFMISAADTDNDTLTYSASNLPSGATFNGSTRTFSWTPRYDQAGIYTVRFQVSDGYSTDSEDITITVAQLHEDWDVNGDDNSNVLDIILIGQRWGGTGPTGWILEDANEDGAINVLDTIIIGQHWTE